MERVATTNISDKGSVTIPTDLRERYGLRAGTRVHIVDYGDMLALVPSAADPITAGFGMLGGGGSLTGALLQGRDAGAARGDAHHAAAAD